MIDLEVIKALSPHTLLAAREREADAAVRSFLHVGMREAAPEVEIDPHAHRTILRR